MLSWDMRMDRDVEYNQRNRCISVRNSSDQAQPCGRQLYLLYTHEHGWFPSLGQTEISLNCWNCHQKPYVGVTGSVNKQICLSLYIYEIWKEKKYNKCCLQSSSFLHHVILFVQYLRLLSQGNYRSQYQVIIKMKPVLRMKDFQESFPHICVNNYFLTTSRKAMGM